MTVTRPWTVATVLEELVALATKEAKAMGQFVVPGLGKAVKASRKARMGRNPQTGEAIKIPAKTVVRFRLAKATVSRLPRLRPSPPPTPSASRKPSSSASSTNRLPSFPFHSPQRFITKGLTPEILDTLLNAE